MKEREQQQNNNDGKQGSSGDETGDKSGNEGDMEHYGDDHSLWEEAFERYKEEQEGIEKDSDKGQSDNNVGEFMSSGKGIAYEIDEREEFSKNRQERIARNQEKLKRMREQVLKNFVKNETSSKINLGDVGESNESIDWRSLLRREIENSETVWSQRRSIAENNYAYRLEDVDVEDDAETEVMIDISGSVNLNMVKGFLRMIKPIFRHSKLKVGCFNEKFWGMAEIKSINDIDNFIIPAEARGSSAWTEDWDLAVRSFTKKREINKIVFTDGNPCPGIKPKDDLRGENVIWLVYGNKSFRPCCGKVINITGEQFKDLYNLEQGGSFINRRR